MENYYTELHEDSRQLQEYIYDPVSEAYNLRKLLVELCVLCFSKLILKKEVVLPNIYEWKFNEPHDYMVSSFTDLVTNYWIPVARAFSFIHTRHNRDFDSLPKLGLIRS